MEQRRLRLGDILDDYCPRERRVTNHAIVAMIEEDVRQTRCTTCDTEHAYNGARVPKRRRKDTPAALFKDVLAGMPEVEHRRMADAPAQASVESPPATVTAMSEIAAHPADSDFVEEPQRLMQSDHRTPDSYSASAARPAADPAISEAAPRTDVAHSDAAGEEAGRTDAERGADETSASDGPVHRRLIRATLPRPEGQKDTRPPPEFTLRAPRNGQGGAPFRGDRMRGRGGHAAGQGEPNGNRTQGQHGRFRGGRQPSGRAGGPSGFRGGHAGPKGGRRGRGSR